MSEIIQKRCKACDYAYSRDTHGDCCSERCVAFLAGGGPTKAQQERQDDPFANRRRYGTRGMFRMCDGCGGRFESLGLRYCPDCYPVMGDPRDKRESAAGRASLKQPCPVCGGDIPAISARGRKTMATYCSSRCRTRAARQRAGL